MSTLGNTSTRRRNPARVRPWRTPPRLAVLFALFMALGSLLPYTTANIAAAPDTSDTPGEGQAQVTGTSTLQVDVVRCPDGFNGETDNLFDSCNPNGIEGIDVQIVSTDASLGIDQTQATAKPTDPGPGRTEFTSLPAGDYEVTINLPAEDSVRYYVYCDVEGTDEVLTPNPDNSLTSTISVPDGQTVTCDWYVIPTEAAPQSTIDLFAFNCAPGALPEGGEREFTDFQTACTETAPGVDFHLVTADNTDTLQTTDQDGQSEFSFPAGDPVRFYSGVPLESEEWLFCSLDQGEPENVEIDAQGVSTFDNAAAEARTCSWFLVEPDTATEVPATEEPTEVPTEEPTTAPTEVPTEVPTEIPATEPPTEAPVEDSTLAVSAFLCASGAIADPDAADFAGFDATCGEVAPGIDFNLNTGELQDVQTTDGSGQASFTFPVGDQVDFYAAVPLEADEYLFCSLDGGAMNAVPMDDQGVAHFENTATGALTCSWFLIEEPEQLPTEVPTEAPTEEPTAVPTEEPTIAPTEEPVVPPSELGQISVVPSTCPQGYDPDTQGVDHAALSTNCAQGIDDITFTFGYPNGDSDVRVSDGQNPLTFANLQPGSYTLFSGVPLEAAQEFVFCTADGGEVYQKELSDRGVTTFGDLQSEQIECEWYIVPTNQRDDETGASLEIHLAVCPVEYTGNTIYDDCHGSGVADQEFQLTGPDGTQTGTTEILQDPGPGVAKFTSLPAGEYTLTGGPPGDFGKIELYCSNQPSNGTPTYSIEGGLASLTLAENQHVLCDWYFIPDNASGQTPTPTPTVTPEPERAEILVTLYSCPPAASQSGTYGGATQETFEQECTDKVNDVSFRLGDAESAPLTAKTGASGEGAVRFYDLLPGDFTMTPTLPSNLTSAAVFCTIDEGTPYQKALSNGGTTFVNVDGESIACSWYAVEDREEPVTGPTGSITIREYLCEKDRSEITDWDTDCAPGSTGTSYTIANTATGVDASGTPNDKGVFVFAGLANGFYTLNQNEGNWCRAVADRVDSQSRVIVEGGGNTDVVLYQCNAVEGLPTTGSGPGGTITSDSNGLTGMKVLAIALALIAVPLAWTGLAQSRKYRVTGTSAQSEAGAPVEPTIAADGRVHMRFR